MMRHPDDSTLRRLLEGELSGGELDAVDAHIDACDACRRLVAALLVAQPTAAELAGDAAEGRQPEAVTLAAASSSSPSTTPPPRRRALLRSGARVDHFVVERLIGRGGMGEVYLARDSKLERPVALKIISPDWLGSVEAVSRFMDEARTTARFSHPHIVAIHAVGEHDGQPYMALEYLGGKTLAQLMLFERPSIELTVRFGLPIAEALAEAHRRGVLHRDLKPSNVMVADDGRLRVLDFGLSKAVSAARRTDGPPTQRPLDHGLDEAQLELAPSGCFGTPTYMAPEQWRADRVSPATDVWALGMILYQLACGYRPYDELPTVRSLMIEVMSPAEVPPLSRVAKTAVPERLAAMIDRCVDKDPATRPSAAEIAETLRTLDGDSDSDDASPAVDAPSLQAEAPSEDGEAPASRAGWPMAKVAVVAAAVVALAVGAFYIASALGRRHRAALAPPTGPALRYGIFPSLDVAAVRRELAPLLRYLRRELRREIEVVTPNSYAALRRALTSAKLDFATLPPLQFALARAKVRAIAAHRYEGASQGYLVARASSAVRDLASARGKRICYVEPGSTSGYLLARRFVRKRGFDPDTHFTGSRFSGTHPQVLRDLLAGRCEIGAVYSEAYLRADRLGIARATLQVVAVTGAVPPDVLAASPKMPAALVSRLRAALLSFVVKKGRTVSELYPLTITGFSRVDAHAYDTLAKLGKRPR